MRPINLFLPLAVVIAGCKSPAAAPGKPTGAAPPTSASALDASVPAPLAEADSGANVPEGAGFSIECGGSSRLPHAHGPPRGCVIRGRVRAVREVVLGPEPPGVENLSGSVLRRDAVRALQVSIEPDDAVPCRTPFDPDAKELRLPEADYRDLDRSGLILVLGGARIAGALQEGASLCGWTRQVLEPGMAQPGLHAGWEGELADGSGALLGASSFYFDSATSRLLARSWRFSREGAVDRRPIDEGGAFVEHRSVRVHHGGASALSTHGAEVVLRGSDGTFAVTATSDLTEGKVPPFVGLHDGFVFSAVRLSSTTP